MINLVGLAFELAGSGLAIDGAVSWWRGHRSIEWPTTEGRIVVSREVRLPRAQKFVSGIVPRVRYEYEVDGRTYYGTRISFGGWGSAQDVVDIYSVGTSWKISYDPDDPANSVLEAGEKGASVLELCVGLGLIIGGVLLVLGVWWLPTDAPSRFSP